MKKYSNIVALLGVLSVVTYCSSNYFGRALTRNSSNAPAVVTQDCSSTIDCTISNQFDPQPTEPGLFWPEIAFIGDTSPSMKNNYIALSSALTGFIGQLQDQGIENFCIGYMPAHAGEYSGLYYAPSGYPKCMCTGEYSVDQMVSNMNYILTHYPTKDYKDSNHVKGNEAFSQSGETGLYSLHNAVTSDAKILANQTAGCMRNEYTFAPIELLDENDIMTALDGTVDGNVNSSCVGVIQRGVDMSTVHFDNSVFPELGANITTGNNQLDDPMYNPTDGSKCQEVQGRFLYYSDPVPDSITGKYKLAITPKSISDELVKFNGALPSFASGVGYFAGDQPHASNYDGFQGQDGPAWGVGGESGLAAEFGQTIANLKYAVEGNQSSFNNEMNKIATSLAQTVTFHYTFDLKDEDGNAAAVCETKLDSLVVKVNGSTVSSSDYTLSSSRTRVTFDQTYTWSFGDKVVITFDTCD